MGPLLRKLPLRTLERVLDDGNDTLKLFGGEVTSALGQIDIGLLADQVGVSATDTSDLGQGVHDLLLSIDVCVQQTDDVLEAGKVSTALVIQLCLRFCIAPVRRSPQSKAVRYLDWPLQSEQHVEILSSCLVPIIFLQHLLHPFIVLSSLSSDCCWTGRANRDVVRLESDQAYRSKGSGPDRNLQAVVCTYLDFSPETSAVTLSACLYLECLDIDHCDPTPRAGGGALGANNARVATSDASRQYPGILTHDGGLSYVVDVVLSMLWKSKRRDLKC